MRSSSLFPFAFVLLAPAAAEAQQQARGFATDRLYNGAPGSTWIVMDDVAMHGALGGAMSVSAQYAHDPFHVPNGNSRLDVVSGQTFANIGFAATYERFRVYLNFVSPLSSTGNDGTVHGVKYSAPALSLDSNPDTFSDVRLGFHVRIIGDWDSTFRAGIQFQLWAPSGDRADYVTDGYYRAMNRFLVAGDVDRFAYAAHVGIQDRSTIDTIPGGPRGSEFLFGAAGGARFQVAPRTAVAVGPEVFGQTAFRELFGHYATGIEALGTGRIDWGDPRAPRLRLKVAAGGGLDAQFGTPAWRTVVALDVMDFFSH